MLPKMRYRLALDIGTKSIGWGVLRLNKPDDSGSMASPIAMVKLGVRIFPDGRNPKDGSSLAVTRRLARQMRRRRDRLLLRKNRLQQALIEEGFFPADEEQRRALVDLDPYVLRKKALYEALSPAEFARALFHINQRRGFKSNRKTDKKDNDSGALKSAIKRVQEEMKTANAQTIGEWLADRHAQRISVRARLRGKTAKEKAYDLYVDRAMIEAEFDTIWAKQTSFNPTIFTIAAGERFKDILLYQRPLKPVEPGRCTLLPDEKRAPLASPMTQRFRILQEINNLRPLSEELTDLPLTLEQRNILLERLETKGDLTFTAIRKALSLPGTIKFNLEDGKREKLKGNATSILLSKELYFGKRWHDFTADQQENIVENLLTEESEAALIDWLRDNAGCGESTAERIANVSLPAGYGSLSAKALQQILPKLQEQVVSYAEAARSAGFHHSRLSDNQEIAGRTFPIEQIDIKTGEIKAIHLFHELPYYGEFLTRYVGFADPRAKDGDIPEKRFGRIANPTVHIGLNEVRKVVNALIKRYGHPSEIVIEVTRDLKNGKDKRDEIQKEQKKRQDQNERWRDEIRPLIGGAEPSHDDLQRMRLWVELNPTDCANRRCPYTGEQISLNILFSDAVEIEHILPFSRTLDDSLNNKTVCLRRANRDKTNKTPFEAFGHSPDGYDYAAILERASLMSKEKARRFAPDAYERWLREDKDFLARALNDTAYLSRVAKEYLSLICSPNKVWVIPGKLTGMLRGKYGFNKLLSGSNTKNRDDHRHHAIDAAVIGITDRGLLKRFADANQQTRGKGINRLAEQMPDPWSSYRDQVTRAVEHIIVSFRPDHGYQSGLHNDTAYGLRTDGLVARRVPLNKFKSVDDIAKTKFSSESFKEWLLTQMQGLSGKDFAAQLEKLTRIHSVSRTRILEKLTVIPIRSTSAAHRHGCDTNGRPIPYKGYKGDSNYCIEIWRNDKGKWEGTVISSFEAYQIVREHGLKGLRHPTVAQNGKPLVMRLMIDDMVALFDEGKTKVMRVATISGNGQIFMAPHNEANVDARNRDAASGFKYISKTPGSLQTAQGRRVTISEIGKIHDPGFKG